MHLLSVKHALFEIPSWLRKEKSLAQQMTSPKTVSLWMNVSSNGMNKAQQLLATNWNLKENGVRSLLFI